MRLNIRGVSLIFSLVLGLGCRTAQPANSTVQQDTPASSEQDGPIKFASYVDLKDHKGKTFLAMMRKTVKPALDRVATGGYTVGGGAAVETAYKAGSSKIKRKVDGWGGLSHVQNIANRLAGRNANLNTLPGMISSVSPGASAYDMSTFLGLASGGGVKMKFADGNFGLNVHYDTTDQRSGRSFGVSPTRGASDASDKDYLDDLRDYTRASQTNTKEFYRALLEVLLNNDGSNYGSINSAGQNVLSDFLAVYTAEQARNLMDGHISLHWDAALLEVTLLANFHAGQNRFTFYYKNPSTQQTSFTSSVFRQAACRVPSGTMVQAQMRDYWQFSRNINDPSNCRRSGINITKDEFRLLGKQITSYVRENRPELFNQVKTSMNVSGSASNLFQSLSAFLISGNAPDTVSSERITSVVDAWLAFLNYISDNADEITAQLNGEQGTGSPPPAMEAATPEDAMMNPEAKEE